MKKRFFLQMLVLAGIATIISCGSTPKFSDATGKEWKLIEARIGDKNILFDRDTLSSEGAGEIFTLNFDGETVKWAGTTNQHTAPYAVDKKEGISITPEPPTEVAAIRQPEKLREQDFLTYLQNVYEWKMVDKNLELLSKTEDGTEALLVFSL